ncbi:aminopeptidase P family protein [uncultured Clostridium sp.]|jgi:Xaa-Pro aminopeptidase|uniref:aminopeptidase P family protein n=1 Tax=uncultured Clostridium sp. TaxID=59620 RepID=UPI002626A2CE|nr:aminopeptidase P family protein [uncultured Clostridium sp.]
MSIFERIKSFRDVMIKENIDYYVIPSEDAHQGEYVPSYYKGRAFMSGFTGSAGTLLIGRSIAILWTDGRYFIQAENQLKGTKIELYKMRIEGYSTLSEWIEKNIGDKEVLAFDGNVIAIKTYKKMQEYASKNNFEIKIDKDLLTDSWSDRPELPKDKAFIHDVKYCGKSVNQKIKDVLAIMISEDGDSYIVSSLDDVAWLFNIRGNDVENNPFVLAHGVVTRGSTTLYIDLNKVDETFIRSLASEGVSVKDYYDINSELKLLEGNILVDERRVSAFLYEKLSKSANVIHKLEIVASLKAIKNNIEIENLERCQIRDGVAMLRFTKWLKGNIGKIEISEISASDKLEEFRAMGDLYKGISFDTIAGHKEHGAMMHYFATKESEYILEEKGFLLVDSGGQYLDGTTDITRTFILGKLTDEEKKDFTLVLKGHLALMNAKFLKGSTGSHLDILARQPLWSNGIDYKCGTGHGVGFFLSVHEGPQGINRVSTLPLELGMILTNEPGIYKEGKHGIRTENTMIVEPYMISEEFGEFYKFRTISYCPIDLDGVDLSIMNSEEREHLNDYHKLVKEKLEVYIKNEVVDDKDELLEFLAYATKLV